MPDLVVETLDGSRGSPRKLPIALRRYSPCWAAASRRDAARWPTPASSPRSRRSRPRDSAVAAPRRSDPASARLRRAPSRTRRAARLVAEQLGHLPCASCSTCLGALPVADQLEHLAELQEQRRPAPRRRRAAPARSWYVDRGGVGVRRLGGFTGADQVLALLLARRRCARSGGRADRAAARSRRPPSRSM